jgi:hypothetical protein
MVLVFLKQLITEQTSNVKFGDIHVTSIFGTANRKVIVQYVCFDQFDQTVIMKDMLTFVKGKELILIKSQTAYLAKGIVDLPNSLILLSSINLLLHSY